MPTSKPSTDEEYIFIPINSISEVSIHNVFFCSIISFILDGLTEIACRSVFQQVVDGIMHEASASKRIVSVPVLYFTDAMIPHP